MKTIKIDPGMGASAGVKINSILDGPLAGWATIEIPENGHAAWESHETEEKGLVISGLVEVAYDNGQDSITYLATDYKYRVGAHVRHRLTAYDGPVKILARFEE